MIPALTRASFGSRAIVTQVASAEEFSTAVVDAGKDEVYFILIVFISQPFFLY